MSDWYGYCEPYRARITLEFCRRYREGSGAGFKEAPFNDKCRNCGGLKVGEETKVPKPKGENQIMTITETEAPPEAVKVARKPGRKPRSINTGKANEVQARPKTRRPAKPKPEAVTEARAEPWTQAGGRDAGAGRISRAGRQAGIKSALGARAASAPVSIGAAMDLLGQALDCLRLILGRPSA